MGLFGCCGLHRIYLGKVGTGVLWFITEGLCWLGQIVDAFQLTEMVKEANGHKHSHTVTVVVVNLLTLRTNLTFQTNSMIANPADYRSHPNNQPTYIDTYSSYSTAPPYQPPYAPTYSNYNQYPPYHPPPSVQMYHS